MIKVEIISSNDLDAIGIYDYQFDSIYIGRSKKADLIFTDFELPLKFLTIKFIQNNLIIQSEPNTPFYFVNGKKLSGLRKLNIGDIIQFGTHKLCVIDAKPTSESKLDNLSIYYDKLNKEAPELKFILEYLEEQIVEFETQKAGKNHV